MRRQEYGPFVVEGKRLGGRHGCPSNHFPENALFNNTANSEREQHMRVTALSDNVSESSNTVRVKYERSDSK